MISGVMIFLSESDKEYHGYDKRAQLRCKHSPPNAVNAEKERQQENKGYLKDERAQKREYCGYKPVIQGGEKARRIDCYTREDKRELKHSERLYGEVEKLGIVADEQFGKRYGKRLGKPRQHNS